MTRGSKTVFRTAAMLLLLPVSLQAAAPAAPVLRFEAPPRWSALVERLERSAPDSLAATMELLGLEDGGPPIRVVLAEEGSDDARRAPSWGVGYAVGGASLVVLLPYRVPAYPDDSLETVLRHELAHVLIARAAGHRPVPRWFNEGLALYAAREWGFPDRSRVLWTTLRHGGSSLPRLDDQFQAGAASAARAYALAGSFVRFLFARHGRDFAARILAARADGRSFYRAFRLSTGEGLDEAEARFWRELAFWNRWVPFLTSSATLWIAVTGLAVWAFRRRRQRDAAIRARWDDEELAEQVGRWMEPPDGGWVN